MTGSGLTYIQADGRARMRRKWRVSKDQGPVVLIAERVVKAMIRRRWPCEWVLADGPPDPLGLRGMPSAVRFVCLATQYDPEAWSSLLLVTLDAVVLLEGRQVQAAVRFEDGVLTAPGCWVSPRGQVRFGPARAGAVQKGSP